MLTLGEHTQWGTVGAVGILSGERYYWFVSEGTYKYTTGVSMLPASTVEPIAAGLGVTGTVLTLTDSQKQKVKRL